MTHRIVDPGKPIRSINMDPNRVTGNIKNMTGKVEENAGQLVGDAKTQAEGMYRQAQGATQELYGQAKDTAVSLEDTIRHFIEDRPYTAVAAALGVGWLIGRAGRSD